MCGIAGYSLTDSSALERTLAAQALLAGIAERGADAVGYAYRGAVGRVAVHKQRSGASELLDQISIPASATEVLVHVRDYTKGHPTIAANNHPVRHGAVVGVHNGIIVNDDELLAAHECSRAEPGMTVDLEAIFAIAAHSEGAPEALEALRGSMAAAWLDERREHTLFAAAALADQSGLAVAARGRSSPRRGSRSRCSSGLSGSSCEKRNSRRERSSRSREGARQAGPPSSRTEPSRRRRSLQCALRTKARRACSGWQQSSPRRASDLSR